MAKRPDLVDITSITNSSTINAINQNWDRIQEAFDNTVSLDGSTPNAMNGDLDINGNALLNVGTIDTENLTLNGQQIVDITSVPEWRSSWVTATAYVKNDLVKINGNVYICLESHTSGTFSTDLTALKWEVLVTKGDSGVGAGDLVSTNNLSDLANPATARSNLSLGTVATENTVPIAKGGTGATDAAGARANLGVQAAGATLDSLEGLSLVAGDILYATGPDTLVRLPIGTAGQRLVVNTGGTAPEWSASSTLNEAAWHPYDMVTPGDGAIGRIYNGAFVATVTTPTMTAGYDYAFRINAVSSNINSSVLVINGVVSDMSMNLNASNTVSGWFELISPALSGHPKFAHNFVSSLNNGGVAANTFNFFGTNNALTAFTFSWNNGGNFDAGQIFMYRRRNYMA